MKASVELSESVELRQNKYLNNRIEQNHRFIKRLSKPGMGFHSFNTARRTIRGFEAMNMLRKGQVVGVEKGDVLARTERLSLRLAPGWNIRERSAAIVGCALRRLFLCGNAIPALLGDFSKSSRVPQSVEQIFLVAA